jgi:hypothetical protein
MAVEDSEDASDVGVPKKEEKTLIFGLDMTDPQDWVTVVLSGIVVYQFVDLAIFFAGKLMGKN